jgi:hypothetical protein
VVVRAGMYIEMADDFLVALGVKTKWLDCLDVALPSPDPAKVTAFAH